MTVSNWRISLFSASGRFLGFHFAESEEEARRDIKDIRLPGDRAEVALWYGRDYQLQFVISDEE
jgi:hypothetical protein